MFHWLKIPAFAFGFLMLFAGSAALAPHGAAAAEAIPVTGEVSGGGTFEGVVVDPVFTAYEEALVFSGRLEGTVTVEGVETMVSQQFDEFANVSDRSNCKTIYYVIDPILVEATGDEIQLDEISMAKPRTGLLGGLLGGNALCVISDLAGDDNGDIDRLADLLNDLLGN